MAASENVETRVNVTNITGTPGEEEDHWGPGPLYMGHLAETLLPIAFILEALAIIVTNLGTTVTVLKTVALRTVTTNLLIVYLSCADFLIGPVLIYLALHVMLRLQVNPQLHAFFGMGIFSMSLRISVLMLTLIGVDRLLAVAKPLAYARIVTRRRVHVIAVTTWCYVAVIVGWTFGDGVKRHDAKTLLTGHPGDFIADHLYRGVLVPHFYLPVFVNCVLYAAIFLLLRRQERRVQGMTGAGRASAGEERRRKHTRRIAKMMTQVLGGMIVTLTPFAILVQLHRPSDPSAPRWWCIAYLSSMFIQYTNSFMNPAIYSWQSPEWRKGYAALLGCRRVVAAMQVSTTHTSRFPTADQQNVTG